MNADCVMVNSGTLRSDRVHPAGDFTMRDLVTIAPFMDGLCLIEVTGQSGQVTGHRSQVSSPASPATNGSNVLQYSSYTLVHIPHRISTMDGHVMLH